MPEIIPKTVRLKFYIIECLQCEAQYIALKSDFYNESFKCAVCGFSCPMDCLPEDEDGTYIIKLSEDDVELVDIE